MNPEKLNRAITRVLVLAILTVYCGLPELATAQTQTQPSQPSQEQQATPGSSPAAPGSDPASAPATEQQPVPSASDPQKAPAGIVDPSAAPIQPVPSDQQQLPNAPSSTASQQTTKKTPAQDESTQQPLGAAGAQVGPTAGGAASKPAGNAIAPAKQRQRRSLLIRVGAVAAAAVAIGTVVALSRGTSSTPPGAR